FNHHAFRDQVRLSGVNSINWARIVAQVTYYFVAASALGAPHRKVSFVVPTGNFGDILAGYVAKRMGLPIEQLVIAANSNDILVRAVDTGIYETLGVHATTSPSMDIQVSSNFERYLFEASGRDAAQIRNQMASLGQSGRFEVGAAAAPLKAEFAAAAASEAEVADAIKRTIAASGYVADPHTACGLVAAERTRASRRGATVVLSTAHPAKFPDSMRQITGVHPPLPVRLSGLMSAPERFDVLPNDASAVEAYVLARARAVRRGAA
ncbi:MAG: threonine synthase, partial [Hyphomicrobiaceae bacterium]